MLWLVSSSRLFFFSARHGTIPNFGGNHRTNENEGPPSPDRSSQINAFDFLMMGRSSFQCLAPAKHLCGGGVVLAVLAWISWAVLFGTFVAFQNRSSSCDAACYDPSFCWPSNITSTPSTTACAGDGSTCLEDCSVPYELQTKINATANATYDDGSLCREINNCDEIVQEESERVSECATMSCADAPKMTSLQSVMTLLGLLLILLSGTFCLNFYREACLDACPPRGSPCKEKLGRVVLYGSLLGAAGLVVLVIAQLVEFAKNGMPGGMADLAVAVVSIYIIGINAILVLFACAGRRLLSVDGAREVPVADDEEERLEDQSARVF